MADSVNMSLDDIIKKNQHQQNRVSRSRGRGVGARGGSGGGRGGGGRGGMGGVIGRGGGRGRGRGGRGGRGGLSQSRAGTPGGRQDRSRSRSRGPRGRSQSRARSQSRSRSRSRQQRRSNSRARSASRSRSQIRGITPKGRAGLELQESVMPQLIRTGGFGRGRGRFQNRLRGRNTNYAGSVHSRLGVTTRRGAANLHRPLAVAKRGISKRGRGFSTGHRYSAVGLRSDQIIQQQRQNMLMYNNTIKSQTFTRSRNNSFDSTSRSRNNSFNSASQLTVSVANDFARRRRNSVGSAGYLNRQSLAQLNNHFGGYNTGRGPGSVKSTGSNKSNRSSRSNLSNTNRSTRSRGRGRGRGIGRNFVNKQMLNVKLQKEIAAIQGKTYGTNANNEAPSGINFTPTPASTGQTLHHRFATT